MLPIVASCIFVIKSTSLPELGGHARILKAHIPEMAPVLDFNSLGGILSPAGLTVLASLPSCPQQRAELPHLTNRLAQELYFVQSVTFAKKSNTNKCLTQKIYKDILVW